MTSDGPSSTDRLSLPYGFPESEVGDPGVGGTRRHSTSPSVPPSRTGREWEVPPPSETPRYTGRWCGGYGAE